MPTQTNHPILALDPGTRDLGFAVLSGRRLIAHGVLRLRQLPREERLGAARAHVRSLVRLHRPRAIAVEKTYRHPVPWLNDLHEITLMARRLARSKRMTFATYSPQKIREVIVGNGKAKKPEVAIAVSHRFPQLRVYLTQDRRWKERYWQNMFDAVALALCYQSLRKQPSRSRRSG